jgi:hypothetical protein
MHWQQELPQSGGNHVAQDCPLTRGEHRRYPSPPPRKAPVPYCVDAAMQSVQSTRANPPADAVLVDPRFSELRRGHDTVLSTRHRPDPRVVRGEKLGHRPSKSPRSVISPPAVSRTGATD